MAKGTPRSKQLNFTVNGAKASGGPRKGGPTNAKAVTTGIINSGTRVIGAKPAGGARQPKAVGTSIQRPKALPRRKGQSGSGAQGAIS